MITPSQRKKVATACGWQKLGEAGLWDPENSEVLWKALISKIAGLIEAMPYDFGNVEKGRIMRRFITALSTNSTHDLESLAYELLEAE